MIKVSPEVCESLLGQLKTTPEMRTNDILYAIGTENPEFLSGMSDIFAGYLEFNAAHGIRFDPEAVQMLGKVALMFGAYGYKLVQTQHEVNEMEHDMPQETTSE